MIRNYFKIAWRNLLRNGSISVLNIGGLVMGMSVAMLIGFWIWDELSYNRYHKNYDSIAQVARREMVNGEVSISAGSNHFPIPLAAELRTNYKNYLQKIALTAEPGDQILSVDNRPFSRKGTFVEPDFPEMFSFEMIAGNTKGFTDPYTILLSQSLAGSIFGSSDPVGKVVKMNNSYDVKVAGVYKDLPANSQFAEMKFFVPMSQLIATNDQVKQLVDNWENSSFNLFVQTIPGADMSGVSTRIKDVYWPKIKDNRASPTDDRTFLFMHPMKDWHLRSEWKNGVHEGGQIQLVKLFGIIGAFVLLLACINFMNLSTARAERRAKEVGVRKTFGSLRSQLIRQFLSESLLMVGIAFLFSLAVVYFTLDSFNRLADKSIIFPYTQPLFWIFSSVFVIVTGLLSGSYPAIYLSAFKPVKVLKGTFRAGKSAALPRRILAGVQFTVSIMLIIGTIVVYKQIKYAQDRPIGYDRNGLVRINMNTPDLNNKYDVLQKELHGSGGAIAFAQSSSATTETNYYDDRIEWEGKDPRTHNMSFALSAVTVDFGKTVGWSFLAGRDFSKSFATDNAAVILNESAVKYMRLADPVGKQITFNGNKFTVVGIIKDMITGSPYSSVQQSVFFMVPNIGPVITIRLNPKVSPKEAISKIQPVFTRMNPSAPFEFKFVDEEYGRKFAAEQRIGVLSALFASLAIIISCIGIFCLASFVAHQRIKEISMRKLLGASVLSLWMLLTREFFILVSVAFVIAAPLANYFAGNWLQNYQYRVHLSWWMFAAAGTAALVVTLLTVSFHALRTAVANPVKSLRAE